MIDLRAEVELAKDRRDRFMKPVRAAQGNVRDEVVRAITDEKASAEVLVECLDQHQVDVVRAWVVEAGLTCEDAGTALRIGGW